MLIVAEMRGNINTNESASMQGDGTHAYSAATPALHSAPIFPPLLCRCVPADSKSKGEMCKFSPELSVLPMGHVPSDFCIHACVVSVIDPIELCEGFLLFFKNIPGWLVLIGTHF